MILRKDWRYASVRKVVAKLAHSQSCRASASLAQRPIKAIESNASILEAVSQHPSGFSALIAHANGIANHSALTAYREDLQNLLPLPPIELQREFARRVASGGEAEDGAARVAGGAGRALRLAPAPRLSRGTVAMNVDQIYQLPARRRVRRSRSGRPSLGTVRGHALQQSRRVLQHADQALLTEKVPRTPNALRQGRQRTEPSLRSKGG